MKRAAALLAGAMLALLLEGCGVFLDSGSGKANGSDARVVVAVIDSAFNPYHNFFHADGPLYAGAEPSSVTPEILEAFGIGEDRILEVTRTGNYAKDVKADADLWKKVRAGRAYWFKGTNVIGISFGVTPPLKPEPAKNPHGVGTSSRVLAANPDAIVVFVEGSGGADGETFAMTHPAIDLISTSYGFPGSLPVPGHVTDSFTGVYTMGKLHFGASDNSPAASPPDTTSGPWWSIGIAGIEQGDSNGRQAVSGNLIDFLGDFTQAMPYCTDCEKGLQSAGGTSFSTPTSAGVMSKILLEARRRTGHAGGIVLEAGAPPAMVKTPAQTITNWQFRRALEEAAWIPTLEDYEAAPDAYPIPPQAAWAFAGWGVISQDPAHGVVEQALAQLGLSDVSIRDKEPGFCDWQTGWIRFRKQYWDTINTGSQTFNNAPSPDPFVYCDAFFP